MHMKNNVLYSLVVFSVLIIFVTLIFHYPTALSVKEKSVSKISKIVVQLREKRFISENFGIIQPEVVSVDRESRNKVTKIIHQSWKEKKISGDFQRYVPSWRKCFPDWEYKFWTDADNRNLVTTHFPWILPLYDSFPSEIYRADLSRYLYMYQYGGIYTDLDNECLRPFEHLLQNYTFVFGTIEKVYGKSPLPENYVQNSFFYSQPKQPFWIELIQSIKMEKQYKTADIVTGPERLCQIIHNYRTRFPNTHGMKIYDAWYFNPISWTGAIKYEHCKSMGPISEDVWKACREYLRKNGSYVAQYHYHTWG